MSRRPEIAALSRLAIVPLVLVLCAFNPFKRPVAKIEDGRRAYNEGRYDEAVRLYTEAVSEPALADNPVLALNRGDAYLRQNDYEHAEAEFTRALTAEDPAIRALAYYNLGGLFLSQKKPAQAAEAFAKSLTIDPGNLSAKYNLEYSLRQLAQSKIQQQQQQRQQEQQQGNQQQQQQAAAGQENQQGEQQEQQKKAATPPPEEQKQEEQQAERPKPGEMSRQQAENILDSLQKREANPLNLQMNRTNGRVEPEKDW